MTASTPSDLGSWEPAGAVDDELLVDVSEFPAPSRHHIVLPASWFALDVRPAKSMRSIRRIVEDRIAKFPETAHYRTELTTLLRAVANDALRNGVRRIALLAEPVAPGQVLAASFTLALGAGLPLPDGGSTNHPEALAAYARERADHGGDFELPVTDREVDLVVLPQQVAVRCAGLVISKDPRTGHTAESFQVRYLIPVPGSTNLATLVFATPCGWAVGQLTPFFDVVAQTFHWSWEQPS